MKRIILLMPYLGQWPEWFFVFLETCKYNRPIDWLFFTDCDDPGAAPSNVRFVHMSFKEMHALACRKIGRPVKLNHPRKICDLRLCYGKIFKEYIQGYDFWGFGDVDVVYGNLSRILEGEALSHDIISFHQDHLSGHLSLFKNNENTNTFYTRIKNFEAALEAEEYLLFDELLFPNRTGYSRQQTYMDVATLSGLSAYGFEAFSTPFSLFKPWTDGTFRFPSEWRWKAGRLSNDIDRGRDFPYLHFMYWKLGEGTLVARGQRHWRELKRIVYIDPAEVQRGFRINCYGFHPLENNIHKPDFIDPEWKLFFRRTKAMVRFHTQSSD